MFVFFASGSAYPYISVSHVLLSGTSSLSVLLTSLYIVHVFFFSYYFLRFGFSSFLLFFLLLFLKQLLFNKQLIYFYLIHLTCAMGLDVVYLVARSSKTSPSCRKLRFPRKISQSHVLFSRNHVILSRNHKILFRNHAIFSKNVFPNSRNQHLRFRTITNHFLESELVFQKTNSLSRKYF